MDGRLWQVGFFSNTHAPSLSETKKISNVDSQVATIEELVACNILRNCRTEKSGAHNPSTLNMRAIRCETFSTTFLPRDFVVVELLFLSRRKYVSKSRKSIQKEVVVRGNRWHSLDSSALNWFEQLCDSILCCCAAKMILMNNLAIMDSKVYIVVCSACSVINNMQY